MNIEVNFNNLTKEEQEQFNALVEKANKPKSKVWKPEVGEKYYCVGADDGVGCYKYDCPFDKLNYVIGNCFKTEEEAKFALERLKVIAEMKRYIAEHDNVELDWKNSEQPKYHLAMEHLNGYRYGVGFLEPVYTVQDSSRFLYASSDTIILDMIKEIGEERVKKYYFGVGE